MELYGRIKCVTYAELVQSKIMSEPSYKKYAREERINVVRPGKGSGSYALIEYNSLPDKYRRAYDEKYPEAKAELKTQFMSTRIKVDTNAVDFFAKHILVNGEHISDKIQKEYVLNANVLNEMKHVENETRTFHKKLGGYQPGLVWEVVKGTCEKLRAEYEHTLPSNEACLKKKFKEYKTNDYVTLISGKLANQNTRKIGKDEGKLLLRLKRSRVPVYTDQQILEEFNRQCIAKKWKQITITTVRNYLYEPAIQRLWYAALFGEQSWKYKYGITLKTELPSMRDALWYSDGTKLNLYYRDEANKMCTISVYEVADAYSETLLGYDIAPGERFDSQYRAFRMAIGVAKHRPYEIVNDNQGGHKKLEASELFSRICRVSRRTMPYNGQSKTIESIFGRFQSQVLHKLWHFTGMNITTNKKTSRPNLEFIEANASKLPTLEELKDLYAKCRKEWNESAHPSTGLARKDMYNLSFNPDTDEVNELDMVQMFWMYTKDPSTYTKEGISIELDKVKYHYQVYDAFGQRDEDFASENIGRKLFVLYDPMDMSMIELYKETGSGKVYVGTATPVVTVHRAIQEQTHEDSQRIHATIENSKKIRAFNYFQTEEFDMENGIHPSKFGLVSPAPKGISKDELERFRKEYEKNRNKIPEYAFSEADEPQTLGQYTKDVSNATYDEINRYDKL